MLSFDEWVAEMSHLDSRVKEMELRLTYRMLEIGCGEPEIGRSFSKEQQDRADGDPTMKELRYLRSQLLARREYLKANGVLPPEETL